MSDNNAPEPTMEEILASIRRIISEDDAPAPAAAPAPMAPPKAVEPEHEPVPTFEEGDDDDVLELTDPVAPEPAPPPPPAPAPRPVPVAVREEAPAQSLGDLDVFTRTPPPRPMPAPPPPAPVYPEAYDHDDGLSSSPTADLAASAFGQLSRTLSMPADGRTLEDVVRELLRPMLKDWLDQNLSGIVETTVQAEVERISRLRRF